MVGEHPSFRPGVASDSDKTSSSSVAMVAGINPEDLTVTIENTEQPVMIPTTPVEAVGSDIPVSQPEKSSEPVDENVPVG